MFEVTIRFVLKPDGFHVKQTEAAVKRWVKAMLEGDISFPDNLSLEVIQRLNEPTYKTPQMESTADVPSQ